MKKGRKTRKIKNKKRVMNAKKTFRRKKMKGGVLPTHFISQQFALKMVNCAVDNLLKPETCYDRIDSTKYKYGTYDKMITALTIFVNDPNNLNFKGTILDELLKENIKLTQKLKNPQSTNFFNKTATNFTKVATYVKKKITPSKPIVCTNTTDFPKILIMICSLKIKSSNIAYLFDKNFNDKWEETALDSFIPANIKEYFIDEKVLPGSSSNIISKPLKEIIETILGNSGIKNIISQIKLLIMKYPIEPLEPAEKNTSEDFNGWYLFTIIMEMITSILQNIELNKVENIFKPIIELMDGYIIKCELIPYLKKNSFSLKTVYKNMGLGYNLQTCNEKNENITSDIYIYDYNIYDFFSQKKNELGILPPFVLLLLSCRINPEINNTPPANAKLKLFKEYMIKSLDPLARNSSSSTDSSLSNESSSSNKSSSSTDSSLSNKSSSSTDSSLSTVSSSSTDSFKSLPPSIDPPTTCTVLPISFIKNYAYKFAYEKSRNFIISNLNLPTILACINGNNLNWNTFDNILEILDILKKHSNFAQFINDNTIYHNLAYYLAPYTIYSPLNIIEYIHTKLPESNQIDFYSIFSFYEEKIFSEYKKNITYTNPNCVPLTIMNEMKNNYIKMKKNKN